MNSFTLLPKKVKIRKCPSYLSGFFITLEWYLWKITHPNSKYEIMSFPFQA